MASDSGNFVTATTVIQTQTTSEHVATRTSTVFGVSTIATTIDGAVVDTVTSFPTGLELVFYSTTEVLNISVTSQIIVTSSFEISSPSATGPLEQVRFNLWHSRSLLTATDFYKHRCPVLRSSVDVLGSRTFRHSHGGGAQYLWTVLQFWAVKGGQDWDWRWRSARRHCTSHLLSRLLPMETKA